MNKLFTKIAKIFLGLSMAAGVGVAISDIGKLAEVRADQYSYTFSSKQFTANGSKTLNGVSWTLAGDGGYWGHDSTKGQQFGSGSKPYKTFSLSTTGISGTITEIVVNASGASSVSATISCTVGGNDFGNQSQSISSTASNKTFSGSGSGKIDITMSQTTSKALYIKTISVTYSTGTAATITGSSYAASGIEGSVGAEVTSTHAALTGVTYTYTAGSGVTMVSPASSGGTNTTGNYKVRGSGTLTISASKSGYTFSNKTITVEATTLSASFSGGTTYTVGDVIEASDLSVSYSTTHISSTSLASGYTVSPSLDYEFVDGDVSSKTFTISLTGATSAQIVCTVQPAGTYHDVTTSVTGYSLTGTTHALEGSSINDIYIVPGKRLDYPDEITITGTGVTASDWSYTASTGLITITNLKADMAVSFDPVDAERELCISDQITEFEKGTDFSSTGIRVYWLYADSELTEDDISAGGETGYSIDSSKYNKNKAGTYKITVSCQGESLDYYVSVVNAPTYEELFTVTSDEVVDNSGYKVYSGTYHDESWVVTYGGNNKSVGSNSSNVANAKLNSDSYSKYAVSPVTTSVTAVAFASTSSIDDVGKIVYQYGNQSGASSAKVYLLYSSNGTTFSQLTLTTGTQGATIGAASTDVTFEFTKCTGYFALVFAETTAISGAAWRIDDVSMTFYEATSSDPSISITSTFTALKYAGETGTVTAEYINESGDEGSMEFESETTSVATIDEHGVVTAVGKGSTLITVSDSEGVATSASFTLRVVSAHKGDRQADALTTEEAVEIYKLDNDHTTEYYVAGTVKEIDTSSNDEPDYFIDKTSANDGFDFYGPEAGTGISLSTVTVDRQVIAKGTIKEWLDGNEQPTGTYGMPGPTIVYANIGTLQSISISGSMTNITYSSKDSEWDMSGITVSATYQGEASTIDVTNEVKWTYNYASPAAVPLTCEKDQSEQVSLSISASFFGQTTSMPQSTTVTITNNGYYIHTETSGWVKTNLADLTSNDVFVIVGNNGSDYAMSNDNGTSAAPSAESVTISNDTITSTVTENIKWNVSGNSTDGYVFYPNGSTTTWLYSITSSNNCLRVGNTASNKTFVIEDTYHYLYNSGAGRYIGVYSSQDWRGYTTMHANIGSGSQTFSFYKKTGVYEVGADLIGAVNSFEGEYSWSAQCTSFESSDWASGGECFTSSIKSNYPLNQIVANINGNKIEVFLAKYDVVIGKFGTTHDFLGRFSEGGINFNSSRIVPMINIVGSTNTIAIIVIISMVSVTAIGGYFFLRKRNEN